jgi:ABC-type transporter Mla subunit MlaD
VVIVAVFGLAATLFRGGFTDSVPVTVIASRAGLVMNPDAKVQVRGVQVGKVDYDSAVMAHTSSVRGWGKLPVAVG